MATAIVCAACNSSDGDITQVPQEEYVVDTMGSSGSRLKRRIMTTDDGAQVFVGWHDSERQENCAFRVGPDGKQRCMPTERVHEIRGLSGLDAVVYADSGCTRPMYATSSLYDECGVAAKYVFQAPEAIDACAAESYYVYAVGDEVELPSGQLYTKRAIACHEFNVTDDVVGYSVTEIPADRFVGSEERLMD
jgi:hypothetical protein